MLLQNQQNAIEIPSTVIFHPTLEEFEDPIAYIRSIQPKAQVFGICKIIPPAEWVNGLCEFNPRVHCRKTRFPTKLQHLHHVEGQTRARLDFEQRLRLFSFRRGSPLSRDLPRLGDHAVDPRALFLAVASLGGWAAVESGGTRGAAAKRWLTVLDVYLMRAQPASSIALPSVRADIASGAISSSAVAARLRAIYAALLKPLEMAKGKQGDPNLAEEAPPAAAKEVAAVRVETGVADAGVPKAAASSVAAEGHDAGAVGEDVRGSATPADASALTPSASSSSRTHGAVIPIGATVWRYFPEHETCRFGTITKKLILHVAGSNNKHRFTVVYPSISSKKRLPAAKSAPKSAPKSSSKSTLESSAAATASSPSHAASGLPSQRASSSGGRLFNLDGKLRKRTFRRTKNELAAGLSRDEAKRKRAKTMGRSPAPLVKQERRPRAAQPQGDGGPPLKRSTRPLPLPAATKTLVTEKDQFGDDRFIANVKYDDDDFNDSDFDLDLGAVSAGARVRTSGRRRTTVDYSKLAVSGVADAERAESVSSSSDDDVSDDVAVRSPSGRTSGRRRATVDYSKLAVSGVTGAVVDAMAVDVQSPKAKAKPRRVHRRKTTTTTTTTTSSSSSSSSSLAASPGAKWDPMVRPMCPNCPHGAPVESKGRGNPITGKGRWRPQCWRCRKQPNSRPRPKLTMQTMQTESERDFEARLKAEEAEFVEQMSDEEMQMVWVTGTSKKEAHAAYTWGICEICFHACECSGGASSSSSSSSSASASASTPVSSAPPAPPAVMSVLGGLSRLRTPRIIGQWGNTLVCRGCKGMYHRHCVAAPDRGPTPRKPDGCDWFCRKCSKRFSLAQPACATPGASASQDAHQAFGFPDGPKTSFSDYAKAALKFEDTVWGGDVLSALAAAESENAPAKLEHEQRVESAFWRHLLAPEGGAGCVEVAYGSDVDVELAGSGFGSVQTKMSSSTSSAAAAASASVLGGKGGSSKGSIGSVMRGGKWDLNELPKLRQSVLRNVEHDIVGLNTPWMYYGMLFSAFAWHTEDHDMHSINFLHYGKPKTWFGVPSSASTIFEEVAKELVPDLFELQPLLLHQLVTVISPHVLASRGVPVYKATQRKNEFIVTFPLAYHSGFNHGLNCAEAINFATIDWLPFGERSAAKYQIQGRPAVLSHEALLCRMIEDIEEEAIQTAEILLKQLKRAHDDHVARRERVLHAGGQGVIVKDWAEAKAAALLQKKQKQKSVAPRTTGRNPVRQVRATTTASAMKAKPSAASPKKKMKKRQEGRTRARVRCKIPRCCGCHQYSSFASLYCACATSASANSICFRCAAVLLPELQLQQATPGESGSSSAPALSTAGAAVAAIDDDGNFVAHSRSPRVLAKKLCPSGRCDVLRWSRGEKKKGAATAASSSDSNSSDEETRRSDMKEPVLRLVDRVAPKEIEAYVLRAERRCAAPEAWRKRVRELSTCGEIVDNDAAARLVKRPVAMRPKLSEVNRLIAAARAARFTELEVEAFSELKRLETAARDATLWFTRARELLGDRLMNERSMRNGLRGATNALTSAAPLAPSSVNLVELRACEREVDDLLCVPHAAFDQIARLRLSAEEWRDAVKTATAAIGYDPLQSTGANIDAALRVRTVRGLSTLVVELKELRGAGNALNVAVDAASMRSSVTDALTKSVGAASWALNFLSATQSGPRELWVSDARPFAETVEQLLAESVRHGVSVVDVTNSTLHSALVAAESNVALCAQWSESAEKLLVNTAGTSAAELTLALSEEQRLVFAPTTKLLQSVSERLKSAERWATRATTAMQARPIGPLNTLVAILAFASKGCNVPASIPIARELAAMVKAGHRWHDSLTKMFTCRVRRSKATDAAGLAKVKKKHSKNGPENPKALLAMLQELARRRPYEVVPRASGAAPLTEKSVPLRVGEVIEVRWGDGRGAKKKWLKAFVVTHLEVLRKKATTARTLQQEPTFRFLVHCPERIESRWTSVPSSSVRRPLVIPPPPPLPMPVAAEPMDIEAQHASASASSREGGAVASVTAKRKTPAKETSSSKKKRRRASGSPSSGGEAPTSASASGVEASISAPLALALPSLPPPPPPPPQQQHDEDDDEDEDEEIHCLCQRPYNAKNKALKLMISCELCDKWFHPSCVALTHVTKSSDAKRHLPAFVCPLCCEGESIQYAFPHPLTEAVSVCAFLLPPSLSFPPPPLPLTPPFSSTPLCSRGTAPGRDRLKCYSEIFRRKLRRKRRSRQLRLERDTMSQ